MSKIGTTIGVTLGVLTVAGGATAGGLKIDQLNKDVEAKNVEIVAQQKDNEALQNQYTILMNNNEDLQSQIEEKDSTISSQQTQLQEKDNTISSQQEQLNENNKVITNLNGVVQNQQITINQQASDLEFKNSQIASLEQQLAELSEQLNKKQVMSISFTDYSGCCTFNVPVDTKYYCSTEYNERTYTITYTDGTSDVVTKPKGTYVLDIENKAVIKTELNTYQYCIDGADGQYDTSTLITFTGETLTGDNGHTDTYFGSNVEFQFTFNSGEVATLSYTFEFDENGLPRLLALDEEKSSYTNDGIYYNILKEQLINNYSFEPIPENPTMFKFSLNSGILILDGVTMIAYV